MEIFSAMNLVVPLILLISKDTVKMSPQFFLFSLYNGTYPGGPLEGVSALKTLVWNYGFRFC
jgi:hypothetical protein